MCVIKLKVSYLLHEHCLRKNMFVLVVVCCIFHRNRGCLKSVMHTGIHLMILVLMKFKIWM